MTASQHVEAVRLVAWALELACAVVVVHYIVNLVRWPEYRLRQATRLRVSAGLVLKCTGWSLHQFYWWIWQVAQSRHMFDLKSTLEDYASITIAAYALIYVGEGLVLSPFAAHVAGRFWPAAVGGLIIGLWALGMALTQL